MRHRPYTLWSAWSEPGRRVLSQDDALALGQQLLAWVPQQSVGVTIEHTARAVTTIANGKVLRADDGDTLTIMFASEFGSGLPVTIGTNQLDRTLLRRVVDRAFALLPPKPSANEIEPDDRDDFKYATYKKREHLPVALWHDSTIRAMETVRGDVVPALVEQLQASQLRGAATVGLAARSSLYLYKPGLTAFSEETDAEVTVTARTSDGTASGWHGQAHRDWARITPAAVVMRAVDLADRSRDMTALEPGRRVAILGPAAVAQLVSQMAELFAAHSADRGGSPFSVVDNGEEISGRSNKIGLSVFDARIRMISDPADPEGGFPPFFEGDRRDIPGYPTRAVTWIDRGVLKELAYTVWYGMKRGKRPCEQPMSVRLAPVPDASTATLDEMIAHCQEGVYVNRFSNVSIVDRKTGLMTGVTRDGCFLVKNGKIERPVMNFRFLDSPFYGFNNVEMIGTPERAAFGYNAPPSSGESTMRWPRLPIVVPPMMIRDFNFTALAEAI